jgi:hypothetical protein
MTMTVSFISHLHRGGEGWFLLPRGVIVVMSGWFLLPRGGFAWQTWESSYLSSRFILTSLNLYHVKPIIILS